MELLHLLRIIVCTPYPFNKSDPVPGFKADIIHVFDQVGSLIPLLPGNEKGESVKKQKMFFLKLRFNIHVDKPEQTDWRSVFCP